MLVSNILGGNHGRDAVTLLLKMLAASRPRPVPDVGQHKNLPCVAAAAYPLVTDPLNDKEGIIIADCDLAVGPPYALVRRRCPLQPRRSSASATDEAA
jgi:hypothetical protein